MTEDDVDTRVLDYFNSLGQVMRSNGLTECFEGVAGRREKCKRLVASLHPASLKNEVKRCSKYSHKPAATDPRLLFQLIIEKATEHERQFPRLRLPSVISMSASRPSQSEIVLQTSDLASQTIQVEGQGYPANDCMQRRCYFSQKPEDCFEATTQAVPKMQRDALDPRLPQGYHG
ncbi:unnamed protein product [Phytophthora fragariaefolia]|uniref:Unnamed protein product n=1 Tax=Phytophthora fragariaefolia TaxID=1490495 RepID=A0A9W6XRB0_9STRA|nr:unnamed protein product [Phytophthora fragariaefolia]